MNINKPKSAISVAKSVQSVFLKSCIHTFDFAKPDFSWLPKDLDRIDTTGLTKMERQILDGILYQYKVTKYINPALQDIANGFYKLTLSVTAFGIIMFSVITITYYLNVKYSLGIKFLTDIFA